METTTIKHTILMTRNYFTTGGVPAAASARGPRPVVAVALTNDSSAFDANGVLRLPALDEDYVIFDVPATVSDAPPGTPVTPVTPSADVSNMARRLLAGRGGLEAMAEGGPARRLAANSGLVPNACCNRTNSAQSCELAKRERGALLCKGAQHARAPIWALCCERPVHGFVIASNKPS